MIDGLDRDGFIQAKEHEFFETERDNAMKTTNDYQLDSLRARFAARGYNTMNHRRSSFLAWFTLTIALLFSIGCMIAAFTLY